MEAKYLILDIRALEGRKLEEGERENENDLKIESDRDDESGDTVLEGGVAIINSLNTLVNEYNYHIVLCSFDRSDYQERFLPRIEEACTQKDIQFPRVEATVLGRKQGSKMLGKVADVPVVAYFQYELPNKKKTPPLKEIDPEKTGMRNALCEKLNIESKQCIVFDSDQKVTQKAKKEGYQAYHITTSATPEESSGMLGLLSSKDESFSLDQAINQILQQEQAKKLTLGETTTTTHEKLSIFLNNPDSVSTTTISNISPKVTPVTTEGNLTSKDDESFISKGAWIGINIALIIAIGVTVGTLAAFTGVIPIIVAGVVGAAIFLAFNGAYFYNYQASKYNSGPPGDQVPAQIPEEDTQELTVVPTKEFIPHFPPVVTQPEKMSVLTIRGMGGDTETVSANINGTVKELREAYKPFLKPDRYSLICNGKELQDADLLSQYNINESSQIYVIYKK